MKKIKKILIVGFLGSLTILSLTVSIKNDSLESLRVNAKKAIPDDCVASNNTDCINAANGNVYVNLKNNK